MKRFIGVLAVLLVVAALGGFWWVTQRLDGTVAAAIEETGSQLLGVNVSVGGVDIDLAGGSARVNSIEVANPRGENLAFSSEPAFRLGEIVVAIDLEALDLENLETAPIPLTLVRVGAPAVNAEVTPAGINLEVLRSNLGEIDATPSTPVQLRIARFEFEDGSLRADTTAVGDEVRDVALPAVHLRNLSGSPEAIGERVLDAFLGAAVRQVARDRLSGEVEEQLDAVKEKAADALRSLLGVEEKD
jgi:hypothetical protein